MQKRLLQRDVADIIGVSTDCISYWENGKSEPQLKHFPRLTSFLGFSPFLANDKTFSGRLKNYRLSRGLSYRQLGALVGVHGTAVSSWENGKNAPSEETLEKLKITRNRDLADLLE